MHEHANDNLHSSLTDLMTSLMVIFILLLLVFLNRTAGGQEAITDALLRQLKIDLIPQGFNEADIRRDEKDRNAILVVVPDRLMNFEIGESTLRPEGAAFLQEKIPAFAGVLCSQRFVNSIDAIVVEGYTDANPYRGSTPEESQNLNLKLSQDRSMEVVKQALQYLIGRPYDRLCFLEKLSASGRGEQDLQPTPEESRRVIFKIRVRLEDLPPIQEHLR